MYKNLNDIIYGWDFLLNFICSWKGSGGENMSVYDLLLFIIGIVRKVGRKLLVYKFYI